MKSIKLLSTVSIIFILTGCGSDAELKNYCEVAVVKSGYSIVINKIYQKVTLSHDEGILMSYGKDSAWGIHCIKNNRLIGLQKVTIKENGSINYYPDGYQFYPISSL